MKRPGWIQAEDQPTLESQCPPRPKTFHGDHSPESSMTVLQPSPQEVIMILLQRLGGSSVQLASSSAVQPPFDKRHSAAGTEVFIKSTERGSVRFSVQGVLERRGQA
jgi:hypothetical protein